MVFMLFCPVREYGFGWSVDYSTNRNLITKVLDFVQLGGPMCTVDGTIFEMWLGHYEPTETLGPKP